MHAYAAANMHASECLQALQQGLAALLVQGLSGCAAEQIARLSPEWITAMGLSQSLTPSRNNGFLNMFLLMQKKALGLLMDAGAPAVRPDNCTLVTKLNMPHLALCCPATLHCADLSCVLLAVRAGASGPSRQRQRCACRCWKRRCRAATGVQQRRRVCRRRRRRPEPHSRARQHVAEAGGAVTSGEVHAAHPLVFSC